jgi:nitrate/nitrite transporter NarK
MLPWIRVLTISIAIFQASCGHALVALPCALGALSDRISSDRTVVIVVLLFTIFVIVITL